RTGKGDYLFQLSDILAPTGEYRHLQHLPNCLVLVKPDYNPDPDALCHHVQPLLCAINDRLCMELTQPSYHADAPHLRHVCQAASTLGLPVVALGDVEMHRRSRQPLHDVLAATRLKKPVHECGHALRPNAEHHLRSRLRLATMYPPEALHETLHISRRCTFSLDELHYNYPTACVPQGVSPAAWLEHETWAGADWRYPNGVSQKVRQQIRQEL